jgi:membrane protease YdiL (CAAX protease family)
MAVTLIAGRFTGKSAISFSELSLIVPVIIVLFMKKRSLRRTFFINPVAIKPVLLVLILTAAFFIVADEINRLLQMFRPMDSDLLTGLKSLMVWENPEQRTALIAGAVILAPICEEFLFRGFVQGNLTQFMRHPKALIAGALCFTFIHFQPWYFVQYFTFGLFLGICFHRFSSVLPCIAAHAFFNGSVLAVNNSDRLLPGYEWFGHVSPLYLGFALVILYGGFKNIFRQT